MTRTAAAAAALSLAAIAAIGAARAAEMVEADGVAINRDRIEYVEPIECMPVPDGTRTGTCRFSVVMAGGRWDHRTEDGKLVVVEHVAQDRIMIERTYAAGNGNASRDEAKAALAAVRDPIAKAR